MKYIKTIVVASMLGIAIGVYYKFDHVAPLEVGEGDSGDTAVRFELNHSNKQEESVAFAPDIPVHAPSQDTRMMEADLNTEENIGQSDAQEKVLEFYRDIIPLLGLTNEQRLVLIKELVGFENRASQQFNEFSRKAKSGKLQPGDFSSGVSDQDFVQQLTNVLQPGQIDLLLQHRAEVSRRKQIEWLKRSIPIEFPSLLPENAELLANIFYEEQEFSRADNIERIYGTKQDFVAHARRIVENVRARLSYQINPDQIKIVNEYLEQYLADIEISYNDLIAQ